MSFSVDSLAAATLDRARLERTLDRATISAKSKALTLQLNAVAPDWRLVVAALEDANIDSATKEYLLATFLVQIRSRVPDGIIRDYVAELAAYQSKTFVWHEEGHLPVEAYPIAQLALGTLRLWDTHEVRLRATRQFQKGTFGALNYLRSPGTVEYAGTLQALQSADLLQISAAKDWLLEYTTTTEAFEAFAIVALQTRDEPLTETLLTIDNGAASLRLLRRIRDHFPSDQSFDLLRKSLSNSMLASAAVAEIDKLRGKLSNQFLDDFFLRLLADPAVGSSAAFALANRRNERVMEKVAAVLVDATANSQFQSRAVLALTLANTNFTRAALQRASEPESKLEETLRQEVHNWLAQ